VPCEQDPLALRAHGVELAAVRVLEDLGSDHCREHQDAHRLLGLVPHLVRAGGATREAGDVTLDELALSLGRSQRRAAAKDDQPLLVRVMEVVRPELLAGIDLVHASADELGAEPRAELGLSNPEALVLLFLLTVVGKDVGDLLPPCLLALHHARQRARYEHDQRPVGE
jgi:hypothetical protein